MARPRKVLVALDARRVRLDGGEGYAIVELPGPIFTESDVPPIFGGADLQEDADRVQCASLLDLAVRRSMSAQARVDERLALAEEERVLRDIKRHAEALQGALGIAFDGEDGSIRLVANFASELRYSSAPRIAAMDLAPREREAIAQALLDLPTTLSCISVLAAHRADRRREGPKERSAHGDKSDSFGPMFFFGFCIAWRQVFGTLPHGRLTAMDSNEQVVDSVRRAASHAVARLQTMGPSTNLLAKHVAHVCTLSDRTIADGIDRARRKIEKSLGNILEKGS